MTDPRIHGPIGEAYAAYDSDPRARDIDGFEAFADAVEPYFPKYAKYVEYGDEPRPVNNDDSLWRRIQRNWRAGARLVRWE